MKAFFSTYRFWITLLGFAALLGLLFWFGARLLWKSNFQLMNRLQELAVEEEILKAQTGRLSELREQAKIIRASRDRLSVVVPKDRIVDLIERLEQLAGQTGVAVTIESTSGVSQQLQMARKAKPAKTAEPKEPADEADGDAPTPTDPKKEAVPETIVEHLPSDQYVEVTLHVTGEYAPLIAFLKKLEVLPYYVDVVDMRIAPLDPQKLEAARGDLFAPPGTAQGTTAPAPPAASAADQFELQLRTLLYQTEA